MINDICEKCKHFSNGKCVIINKSFPIDTIWFEYCLLYPKDDYTNQMNINRIKNKCPYSGKILTFLSCK